jgi:hypothetical protein
MPLRLLIRTQELPSWKNRSQLCNGKKRDAKRALTSQNTRVIIKARRMFEAEDIRRAYSFFQCASAKIFPLYNKGEEV